MYHRSARLLPSYVGNLARFRHSGFSILSENLHLATAVADQEKVSSFTEALTSAFDIVTKVESSPSSLLIFYSGFSNVQIEQSDKLKSLEIPVLGTSLCQNNSPTQNFLAVAALYQDGAERTFSFSSMDDSFPTFLSAEGTQKEREESLQELISNPPSFFMFSGTGFPLDTFFSRLTNIFTSSESIKLAMVSQSRISAAGVFRVLSNGEIRFNQSGLVGLGVTYDQPFNREELASRYLDVVFSNGFYSPFRMDPLTSRTLFLPKEFELGPQSKLSGCTEYSSVQIIPIFRLSVMLFPECETPLRIFEPRYRAMIKECIENKSVFGILYPGSNIGCAAYVSYIQSIEETGESVLMVRGLRRFYIKEDTRTQGLYGLETSAVVYFDDEETFADKAEHLELEVKLRKHIIELVRGAFTEGLQDIEVAASQSDASTFSYRLAYDLSQLPTVREEDKLAWLKTTDASERLVNLSQYFDIDSRSSD